MIKVVAPVGPRWGWLLSDDALSLVEELALEIGPRREALLEQRRRALGLIRSGVKPEFPPETEDVREGSWRVAPIPEALKVRYVEITGPSSDRKMVINALNSGADVYMTDFEDSMSPTWQNVLLGQENLRGAVRRELEYEDPVTGRRYELGRRLARLAVRPRGLHLVEKHVLVDGRPVPATIFDLALYASHNLSEQLKRGDTPHVYIPKMEGYLEARWWNDLLRGLEERLGAPMGSIRVTVLIEHILATFQIEEILYELRERVTGLNLGRWDYIFSYIKVFGHDPSFLLPERGQVTIRQPFLRAAYKLLVHAAHTRGAYAIGGMSAYVPKRGDPKAEEALRRVVEDKALEISYGVEGAWVAHPDLVPHVREAFENGLQGRPNQLERVYEGLVVKPEELIEVPRGTITEAGVRNNVEVALRYLENWLRGVGSAAIFGLMEDLATSEIARSQLWQWLRHKAHTQEGRPVDESYVRNLLTEVMATMRSEAGHGQLETAEKLLWNLITSQEFVPFTPDLAYPLLD